MLQTQIETLTQAPLLKKDFPKIDNLITALSTDLENGKISKSDINAISQSFGKDFLENTMQGYGLLKPFGYAGDFLMIDKIYTYHKSSIKKYEIWDEYFHQHAAPKAVRNRKNYFKKIMNAKMEQHPKLDLMNVASGPARDLFELYETHGDYELNTTCVEMDGNAIKYAKELNQNHLDKISFVHKNIFKHREKNKFDVIWSAGLFDYFDDRTFAAILGRFKNWLKPGGEIIIGNFNENHNPSRDYMELFGDWYLHHRTESQLIALAEKAGFDAANVRVGKEKENVNLFLHIQSN